ncbi:MAG TPA: hypothetical protein VGY54_25820 [Polyangiaceae bacterium]|nr:hypothetical protein [Polyangiaceae bacterium]
MAPCGRGAQLLGRDELWRAISPVASASVTGEVLRPPNAKMKEQLGKGGPKLFRPWMALQDQELVRED